jgi:putative SOS response-associated peptidase YedK
MQLVLATSQFEAWFGATPDEAQEMMLWKDKSTLTSI